MWSGPEAAGGVASTLTELRRGYIWLVQIPPERGQRAMLLLSRDRDGGVDEPLLAAPLVRGAAAAGRVAVEIPPGFEGAVIDVRRLSSIDRSALVQPIARLAAPQLAAVDKALCDVLGLDVPVWPSAAELERRLLAVDEVPDVEDEPAEPLIKTDVAQPAGVIPLPSVPPTTNGEGSHFAQPAAFAQSGFGPPPAPPPVVPTTRAMHDDARDGVNVDGGLDEHPIARLFGRPRPATLQPSWLSSPAGAGADATRASDVMPEMLDIVQRRLHRSAPRLEAVLSQAAEEGRSVEWAAAAVRHASVRGVMQSTLDEIAAEISAVGAQGGFAP